MKFVPRAWRPSGPALRSAPMDTVLLTAEEPGIGGRLRTHLEDFRVEEDPAYAPTGHGEHLFVRLEKRDLTTPEAVRRLASALQVDPKQAGWAGLKDRRGITIQWVSLFGADPERARSSTVEGVHVLEAARHPHKLRTGHLHGNHFQIVVRNVNPNAREQANRIMTRLSTEGMPNYFGEQRFGIRDRNVDDARRWLIGGGRPPRAAFARKMYVSALQSALFNDVLIERVRDGALATAVLGDVLKKEDTGGLFCVDDFDDAQSRVASWAASPTGPIFGAKMMWPDADARARELSVLKRWGLTTDALESFARYGSGSRRVLRVRPTRWSITQLTDDALEFCFYVPKGVYATTLMREVMKAPDEPEGEHATANGDRLAPMGSVP
jgi:tRNA pseudouridine13 synthase